MDARCAYILQCICEIFGTSKVKTGKTCDYVYGVQLINGVVPLRCQTFELHSWAGSVGVYMNCVEIIIPDMMLTDHDQVIRKLREEMEY